jgi:HSP20 family molecular chaperone IbpA
VATSQLDLCAMVLQFSDHMIMPSLLGAGPVTALLEQELFRPLAKHMGQEESALEAAAVLPRYQHLTGKSMDIVTVELPGVEKENVTLDVKEHLLRVSAERLMPEDSDTMASMSAGDAPPAREPSPSAEHADERAVCADGGGDSQREASGRRVKYSGTFALARNTDVSGIQADYKNGLLTVKIPHRRQEMHRVVLQ